MALGSLSPFERALDKENEYLCDIHEKPMPEDYLAGKRVYIGPALPPFRALKWALFSDGWKQAVPEEEEPEPPKPEKDFCCIPKPPG